MGGLQPGEGFSFGSFVFLLLRFLWSRFSVTVMSLAFYTDIESSRVEQQQQQQQQQQGFGFGCGHLPPSPQQQSDEASQLAAMHNAGQGHTVALPFSPPPR